MWISLIAAIASNHVIGYRGAIPWSIPEEQQRFKEITLGHTVIMGRKTYESIGKSLMQRINIVVTRQSNYIAPGCLIAKDLCSAIKMCPKDEDEAFICGGGQLYNEALPLADRIYISLINKDISGDIYFPRFSTTEFSKVSSEYIDGSNPYIFSIYERIRRAEGGGL